MRRPRKFSRPSGAAAVLALAALAAGVAVSANDDPSPAGDREPDVQLVRGANGRWCVEVEAKAADRALSQCAKTMRKPAASALLSVDCPTEQTIAFGSLPREATTAVRAEGARGPREAELTPAEPGAPVRGFAVSLDLDDFPAKLVLEQGDARRTLSLPDAASFCRDSPDFTTLLPAGG